MKLLYQTHSPYARKALVLALEAGLGERIEVVHHETSPTNANGEVFGLNPLGKVPVLIRPGLSALFDSDVICAYFDTLSDRSFYPVDTEQRLAALRMQALAQGLADSGIALRWETVRRPQHLRFPPLAEGYRLKLVKAYHWLEEHGEYDGDAQYYRAISTADARQRQLLARTRDAFLRYRDQCPSENCIAETYRGRMREINDIAERR